MNRTTLIQKYLPLFTGIIHDLSDIKQAESRQKTYSEKLSRSNDALKDFAGAASHDLQEPLREIITFGDRLKQKATSLEEHCLDYLERMQKSARRMQGVIGDLLEFSKVASKGRELESVDLQETILDIHTDLEVRISEINCEIVLGELPKVCADTLHMRRLFFNLISNALKCRIKNIAFATKVCIKSQRVNGFCEISVEDNGIGFDMKHLYRIFRPFHRLHGRNEYEGTGMVLSMCKKITEMHDGEIMAESEPLKGARFIIRLPGAIVVS